MRVRRAVGQAAAHWLPLRLRVGTPYPLGSRAARFKEQRKWHGPRSSTMLTSGTKFLAFIISIQKWKPKNVLRELSSSLNAHNLLRLFKKKKKKVKKEKCIVGWT